MGAQASKRWTSLALSFFTLAIACVLLGRLAINIGQAQPVQIAAPKEAAVSRKLAVGIPGARNTRRGPQKFRVLHIITSLDEASNLGRGVVRGSSRWPTIQYLLKGVVSLCEQGIGPDYDVEVGVQIIAGWAAEARRKEFEEALKGCGAKLNVKKDLYIWENAIPTIEEDGKTRPYKRALAKQHRFVVKREWDNYDMFSAWEDDMYVGANHYQHFIRMSQELEDLADAAPEGSGDEDEDLKVRWDKALPSSAYLRMLPGFVRVESALVGKPRDEGAVHPFYGVGPNFPEPHPEAQVHRDNLKPQFYENELLAWEWDVDGMGVRKFPEPFNGWVGVIPGRAGGWLRSFTEDGPSEQGPGHVGPERFGQQAGWMATKVQIERFQRYCPRGFLPPDSEEETKTWWWPNGNVEFWSGGFQLFGPNRCRVARVLDLRNEQSFVGHMLFHTSNNKQVQVAHKMTSVHSIHEALSERREKAQKLLAPEKPAHGFSFEQPAAGASGGAGGEAAGNASAATDKKSFNWPGAPPLEQPAAAPQAPSQPQQPAADGAGAGAGGDDAATGKKPFLLDGAPPLEQPGQTRRTQEMGTGLKAFEWDGAVDAAGATGRKAFEWDGAADAAGATGKKAFEWDGAPPAAAAAAGDEGATGLKAFEWDGAADAAGATGRNVEWDGAADAAGAAGDEGATGLKAFEWDGAPPAAATAAGVAGDDAAATGLRGFGLRR